MLDRSCRRGSFSRNVRTETRAGKTLRQALAIAYSLAAECAAALTGRRRGRRRR